MESKILLELLHGMIRIRLVEEGIISRYAEQEMRCPVHLSIGQEATPVAVSLQLTKKDYVFSTHRSHGHYIAKGGDINKMLAEIYGKETGCCGGRGGSMHLQDLSCGFLGAVPIVGSTIPIAVGAALSSKMKNEERIIASFFGDGTVEEGVFFESVNFALLKELPILFICENNLYSVYSPLSVRQPPNREIISLAKGLGIHCLQGDGNNPIEVYNLVKQAIDYIRSSSLPVFLELKTYRWREHCGPNYDNNIGYRTEEEFLCWKNRCPIHSLQSYLISNNITNCEQIECLISDIQKEVDSAFEYAIQSCYPSQITLMNHVYAQ